MDLLPKEIICIINDSMHIIDQVQFSRINRFNHQSIILKRDLPFIMISRGSGECWGAHGSLLELSCLIRLDYLKTYLSNLQTELAAMNANPPERYSVKDYSEVLITILVENKPINFRKPIDVSLCMNINKPDNDRYYNGISYQRHKSYSNLIKEILNIYEKKKAESLPLLLEYC